MEVPEVMDERRYTERVKAVVSELLGEITELPLIFEGNLLCPGCLARGLVIAGGWYRCVACGFQCIGTVVLTEQGRHWMMMNDVRD